MSTLIALPIGHGLELQDSESKAEPGHMIPTVIDVFLENPIHRMDIRGIFLEWIFARRRLIENNCSKTIARMTKLVRFFILQRCIFRLTSVTLKRLME